MADQQNPEISALRGQAAEARRAGDLGDAFRLLSEARDRAVGDAAALAAVELELGRVAAAFGDPEEARSQLDSALERYTTLEDDPGRAEALFEIGCLDAALGANDRAKACFRRAAEFAKRNDMAALSARCQLELAAVGVVLGDLRIAQLDLRSAAATGLWRDDQGFRAEGLLVEAELAHRLDDEDRALVALANGIDLLGPDDPRREQLTAALSGTSTGEPLPARLRRPAADGEVAVTEARFTIVGLDGNGDLEAATTTPTPPSAEIAELGRSLVEGIIDHRTVRLPPPSGGELTLSTSQSVHGLAASFLIDGDLLLGFSVMAAGVDPDELRGLRDATPFIAYIAGRWRTGTTVGFGRAGLIRPGALTTIEERPVAFVRWVGPPDHPVAAIWLDLFTGVAQAWFSMIQADSTGARRLRATRQPMEAPIDPDLPEW